jgi:hypothetical protein
MQLDVQKLALSLSSIAVFVTASARCLAQNTSSDVSPVIDAHAMGDADPSVMPMCPNTPKFTASDPDTKEAPFG